MYDFFCKKEKEINEDKESETPNIVPTNNKSPDTGKLKNFDQKLLVSAKIVERMINLNTYDEIARDFRFYEVKEIKTENLTKKKSCIGPSGRV